jgi:hypothetical protein
LKKIHLPFLTVQNLTVFESRCRAAAQLVDSFRGPLPYIIREEMLPVGLRVQVGGAPLHHVGSTKCCYGWEYEHFVHQNQKFRFMIKTRHHGTVQVSMDLKSFIDNEEGFSPAEPREIDFLVPDPETRGSIKSRASHKVQGWLAEEKEIFDIL